MVSNEMEQIIGRLKVVQAGMTEYSVEGTRTSFDLLASLFELPKDVKYEPVNVEGISAEWVIPPGVDTQYVILYLHGGGYVAGSIRTYRELATRIGQVSKARVLILDYRLAPEHPFPAAVEDATAAYHWLLAVEGIEPEHMVIAGDSAGGGLTLACLVKLRDAGIALPAGAVCLSPATDLALTGESIRKNAKLDPFLTPELVKFLVGEYLGEADPRNPLASPLYADLKGLPPLFIQVGTDEILLDDSVRFAERAKAAGVNVTLDVWQDMIHIFAIFAALTPEGRQGVKRIGEFIRNVLP